MHTHTYIPGYVVTVIGKLDGPSNVVIAYIVHSYVVDEFNPVTVPLVFVPTIVT